MKYTFNISYGEKNRKLYKFILKVFPNVSKKEIEKTFRLKNIKINNIRTNDKSYVLKEFDTITIYGLTNLIDNNLLEKTKVNVFLKSNINKIYEDDNILIVNKKNNLVIHGQDNSLDNLVLQYLKNNINPSFKPTHIHRIDKKCSGVVVYAKTLVAAQQLKEKINKQIKIYVFKSKLNKDVDLKIKLSHNEKKQKIVPSKFGKLCHTKFYLKNNIKYAQIFTGFKHQIRASLASLGCPIIGDTKYGGEKAYRLFLHSYQFTFKELDKDLKYLNNKTFIAPIPWKQG